MHPNIIGSQNVTVNPKTWNKGKFPKKKSSPVRGKAGGIFVTLWPIFLWESWTILGSFSLPLVNKIWALSSAVVLGNRLQSNFLGSFDLEKANNAVGKKNPKNKDIRKKAILELCQEAYEKMKNEKVDFSYFKCLCCLLL